MTPIAGAGDFAVFMKSRELHCASLDMATIAIGDIHGNLPALTDVLAKIRRQVSGQDTVVFLGDYIDRGPDTEGLRRRDPPVSTRGQRGGRLPARQP